MSATGKPPANAALPASAPAQAAAVTVKPGFWAGRTATILLQVLVILAVLAAWQIGATSGFINKRVLSDPSDVAARFVKMLSGEDVFGATIYAHVWQTLQELFLGYLLGSVLGILLGVGGARALTAIKSWPTLISVDSVVIAFVFSAAVGIFFGFYPARKASRLDPIDALRYE